MDHKLPDLRDMAKYVRGQHPDKVIAKLSEIKAYSDSVANCMKDYIDNVEESTCSICGDLGYEYKDIPDDWAYIADGGNTLLCNNCLGRWYERFGTLPELSKEIEL